MSDGEPGGMTDPPPVVRLEACLLAETAHAFLELLSDIAVGVRGVQDEHGCGLDQVHVGRWFPGSMMMVVACLSRTVGCIEYSQSVNGVSYLGESGAGPIRPFQPSISAPSVILQSTHEAALDVVDLADLKHRALELS
jgi:hypothetical protein